MIIHTVLADTVKGGDVVILGGLVGVAASDGDSVSLRAVHLQGVYRIPKGSSTFTQGDNVYWDSSAKEATSVSDSNTLIGLAFADAGALDTELEVGLMNSL